MNQKKKNNFWKFFLFKNFKQQKSEKYLYSARIFLLSFFKAGVLLYGPEPGLSPTFLGPARPEPDVQSPARPEPDKTPARYVPSSYTYRLYARVHLVLVAVRFDFYLISVATRQFSYSPPFYFNTKFKKVVFSETFLNQPTFSTFELKSCTFATSLQTSNKTLSYKRDKCVFTVSFLHFEILRQSRTVQSKV